MTPSQMRRRAVRSGWPPIAAAYHFGTRGAPILHGDEAEAYEASLTARALTDPPPPAFKRTRGRGIELPARPYSGEFASVLLSRRTWRGFGRRPISRTALGTLLDLSFGHQMRGLRNGVPVVFKTSPSGGACHPIEAYVVAVRVRGVEPGIYHYSPRTCRLHAVGRGATSSLLTSYLGGQWWFGDAGAAVLMTAVMPRAWWRYPHARSYRAVLLEAGHFCQTFCLVATWLRLAPFCTMALDEIRIEKDLGIDGTSEVLLYAAGVGTRPPDGRWVQWPGNVPGIRLPDSRSRSKTARTRATR